MYIYIYGSIPYSTHLYIHIFYDFVQSGIRTKYFCSSMFFWLSCPWSSARFHASSTLLVGFCFIFGSEQVGQCPQRRLKATTTNLGGWWWLSRLKATKLYPDVETYINNVLFERGTEISQIYTSAWCKPIDIFQSRTRTHQPRSNIISTSKVFKSIPHGLVFRM